MKVNLKSKQAIFPMPVLMVAAYDENKKVNVMNAAWGMNCGMDKILLTLSIDHKTTQNILKSNAFSVSIADVKNMEAADFFGIASGNKIDDKFERTGLTAKESEFANCPIIQEFPVTMECELLDVIDNDQSYTIIGKVVNVCADEEVLDNDKKVDPLKLNALIFDTFGLNYYTVGEKVGKAWKEGKSLMK